MTETQRVPLPDGTTLPAAVAVPTGAPPFPAVIVVHETFGVNDDMRAVCERFASAGYVAAAPDLFAHGNRIVCLTQTLLDRSASRAMADLEAVRTYLAERDDVDGARVGVIGFCIGGGFALLFAARGGVRVASVNYGTVPKSRAALARTCPVVASYGGRDLLFRGHADRLEEHLRALGVPHDVQCYPAAGHSFMTDGVPLWMARIPSPMNAGYVPEAADDAWKRTFAFFDEHLGRG